MNQRVDVLHFDMYGNTQTGQAFLPQNPSTPTNDGFQQFHSAAVDNLSDPTEDNIILHHTSGKRMKHDRSRAADFSKAFDKLRGMIPTHPRDRRLSKSEILRLATSYIRHLSTILDTGIPPSQHPCMKSQNSHSFPGDSPRICTFCINEHLNSQSTNQKEA